MREALVAFFSVSGTTDRAVQILCEAVRATVYAVCPAQPYVHADLNWTEASSRCIHEDTCGLLDVHAPVEEFGTILVVFPIWQRSAPPIIRSFLGAYDFSGKHVILFATSTEDSSTVQRTVADDLSAECPGAQVSPGLILNRPHITPGYLRKWLHRHSATSPRLQDKNWR